MNHKKYNNSGFSLIEILIVIGIIFILASIIVIYFPKYLKNTYKTTALSNARNCLSIINTQLIAGENPIPPTNCIAYPPYDNCSCSVSGFAGKVKCSIYEGGSVLCQEE